MQTSLRLHTNRANPRSRSDVTHAPPAMHAPQYHKSHKLRSLSLLVLETTLDFRLILLARTFKQRLERLLRPVLTVQCFLQNITLVELRKSRLDLCLKQILEVGADLFIGNSVPVENKRL